MHFSNVIFKYEPIAKIVFAEGRESGEGFPTSHNIVCEPPESGGSRDVFHKLNYGNRIAAALNVTRFLSNEEGRGNHAVNRIGLSHHRVW
jgi:hypothetical protein